MLTQRDINRNTVEEAKRKNLLQQVQVKERQSRNDSKPNGAITARVSRGYLTSRQTDIASKSSVEIAQKVSESFDPEMIER
jgi:hypothetical protein